MGVGKAGEAVPRQSPEGPDPESSGVAAWKSVVAHGAGTVGVTEHSSTQHPMWAASRTLGLRGRQSWQLGRGWGSPAIPGHMARWVEPRPGAGRSVSLCAWLGLSVLLS